MIYMANIPVEALNSHILHGAPHYAPILVAVRDAGLAFAIVPQGQIRFRIPVGRPAIVVIGDDLDQARGPGAFHTKSLTRFLRTCRAASIVASGAQREPYAAAAEAAIRSRQNTVVIETLPRFEQDWFDLVQRCAPSAPITIFTVAPAGHA